jgi:hypothetical protein
MNDPDELKQVNSVIQTKPPPIVAFFFRNEGKIGAEFLDAHLTRVAPE